MRPPAIFRAFQQDDRPTSYSQGYDGRTIRRQSITSVRYAIAYRKSWVWSTDIDARALALRARVRAHDHTIAIIKHVLRTCCMHCTLSRAFRPRCLSSSLSLSLNMKRGAPSLEGEASSSKQRRTVSYSTFRKWKTELDKDCHWLECDNTATGTVTALKCRICIRFQSAIERRRNYSDRRVIGAESLRNSNIRDHAKTDKHQHAMVLWKKQQATARGLGPSAYSPIARLLSEISDDTMAKL